MPRPLEATIHLAAMRHNLARAQAMVPVAKVWAVVKAHAYGHGLAQAVQGFAAADGLALIELEGANRLRELGWQKPILLLEGIFEPADLQQVFVQNLDIVVHSEQQITWLEQAASSLPMDLVTPLSIPVRIHLKMNSGMNRLGFTPAMYASAYARLRALPNVGAIILMTHFANADQARPKGLTVAEQMQRFAIGTEGLAGEYSFSNSSATLHHAQIGPAYEEHWIRPGIMLYGGISGQGSAAGTGLLPAMSLRSELIGMQTIAAGEAVGYAGRFIAKQPMRIGIVACGYADGYPRHAPDGTPILVDGIRTCLAGQVSMDMITVDLTPMPHARIGSLVTLWGEGLPIEEVAHAAGTISYELMCALAARVRVVVEA
jgi:alanine racemase